MGASTFPTIKHHRGRPKRRSIHESSTEPQAVASDANENGARESVLRLHPAERTHQRGRRQTSEDASIRACTSGKERMKPMECSQWNAANGQCSQWGHSMTALLLTAWPGKTNRRRIAWTCWFAEQRWHGTIDAVEVFEADEIAIVHVMNRTVGRCPLCQSRGTIALRIQQRHASPVGNAGEVNNKASIEPSSSRPSCRLFSCGLTPHRLWSPANNSR